MASFEDGMGSVSSVQRIYHLVESCLDRRCFAVLCGCCARLWSFSGSHRAAHKLVVS